MSINNEDGISTTQASTSTTSRPGPSLRSAFPEQWDIAIKPRPGTGDVSITAWDDEHYLATTYNKKRQLMHTNVSLIGGQKNEPSFTDVSMVSIYINKIFKLFIRRKPYEDTLRVERYPKFYIMIYDLIPADQKRFQKLLHDYTYSKKYKVAEGWFRGGRWDEIWKYLSKKYKMDHKFAPHV